MREKPLTEPGETQFPVLGLNPRLDLRKQRLFTVGPKGRQLSLLGKAEDWLGKWEGGDW